MIRYIIKRKVQNNSKLETCQQFLDKLKSSLENGDTPSKNATEVKDTDDTLGGKKLVGRYHTGAQPAVEIIGEA